MTHPSSFFAKLILTAHITTCVAETVVRKVQQVNVEALGGTAQSAWSARTGSVELTENGKKLTVTGDVDIPSLLQALSAHLDLEVVELANAGLRDEDVSKLAPALAKLAKLRMLDMKGNKLGPAGFETANEVANTCHGQCVLRRGWSWFQRTGGKRCSEHGVPGNRMVLGHSHDWIHSTVKDSSCAAKLGKDYKCCEPEADQNDLWARVDPAAGANLRQVPVVALATEEIHFKLNAAKAVKGFTNLDFHGMPVDTQSAAWIGEVLGEFGKLEELHLYGSGLTPEAVQKLAPALGELPALKVLDLQQNPALNSEAIGYLLPALTKLRTLTGLLLAGNGLTMDDVIALQPVILGMKYLETVAFGGNSLEMPKVRNMFPKLQIF